MTEIHCLTVFQMMLTLLEFGRDFYITFISTCRKNLVAYAQFHTSNEFVNKSLFQRFTGTSAIFVVNRLFFCVKKLANFGVKNCYFS